MSELALVEGRIAPMTVEAMDRVRRLEAELRELPQCPIATHHVLHGGMYARTIMIPGGVALAGVHIQRPTTLVFNGDATVFTGQGSDRLVGYHVLAASAGRRQAFHAHGDTWLTMVMATDAATVAAAEEQFTDEVHLLFSRGSDAVNNYIVTGE